MTYTWRLCSLFIFRSPTAWAQPSAVCSVSATVSFITFSSPCSRTHTHAHRIHSNLGARGSMAKKRIGQIKRGPIFSRLSNPAATVCVDAFNSRDANSSLLLFIDRLQISVQSQIPRVKALSWSTVLCSCIATSIISSYDLYYGSVVMASQRLLHHESRSPVSV